MTFDHDLRIDNIKHRPTRQLAQRLEILYFRLFSDPNLVPMTGALLIATCIWLASYDSMAYFFTVGHNVNSWNALLFLLGVQYSRTKWPRTRNLEVSHVHL